MGEHSGERSLPESLRIFGRGLGKLGTLRHLFWILPGSSLAHRHLLAFPIMHLGAKQVPPSSTKKSLDNADSRLSFRPGIPLRRSVGVLPVSPYPNPAGIADVNFRYPLPNSPTGYTSTLHSSSERRSQASIRSRRPAAPAYPTLIPWHLLLLAA